MKFILSSVLSQCGLKVNWWHIRHIQATGESAGQNRFWQGRMCPEYVRRGGGG
jgi:hypothetical protein